MFESKLAIAAASRSPLSPAKQETMDISTASGSNELPDLETSASPIDPALTGMSKGKRKADGGDDGDPLDDGTATGKKRRNRKVRTVRLRTRRVLTTFSCLQPVTCARECRRRPRSPCLPRLLIRSTRAVSGQSPFP